MKPTLNLAPSSTIEKTGFTDSHHSAVVAEFDIENNHFLIITQQELEAETQSKPKSNPDSNAIQHSVVGHFKLNQKSYLIVKAEDVLPTIAPSLTNLLTERELQITAFVASGYSNKQVALQLKISEWTVSAHLRRIFVKLGVDSRTAMVYRCASLIR